MEVKRKGSLLSFRPDIKVLDATLRDGGLCNIVGESKQPAALSAGQKHGDAFLFSLHNKTP